MSNFEIIKQDARFALFQNGKLIGTYSRKDSAVRRMRKMEQQSLNSISQELFTIQCSEENCDFRVYADGTVQDAEEEPFSFMSDDFCIISAKDEQHAFLIWQAKDVKAWVNGAKNICLSEIDNAEWALEGVAQAHAQTQRAQRGSERGVARSPP